MKSTQSSGHDNHDGMKTEKTVTFSLQTNNFNIRRPYRSSMVTTSTDCGTRPME